MSFTYPRFAQNRAPETEMFQESDTLDLAREILLVSSVTCNRIELFKGHGVGFLI